MDKLLQGIRHFKSKTYPQYQELYESLQDAQQPHTLFITCSDSRVDPQLLTQCGPGELFVLRNVANMVPPYPQAEEAPSAVAVIEYAVNVLEVEQIVVCGHSNCGGCAGLYLPESKLAELPHTARWLRYGEEAKERARRAGETDAAANRARLTERANVLVQLDRLAAYPFIEEKHRRGEIGLSGWHYVIPGGEVYIYNRDNERFEPAN
jgi:carbonic anhydrase